MAPSVRGQRYYRNRSGIDDSWVPGIGIGIESCPSLESVLVSESVQSWTRYQYRNRDQKSLNLAQFYVNTGKKRSLLSYLWTSPYKGKGINIRIYQQLPESNWSRNRPEMVRIGIGIESCLSLESVSVSESVQCWTRYQYRNRDRKSWYRRLLACMSGV